MDQDLEQMMGLLGEFGPYQMRQFVLLLFAGGTAGVHMLSLVFVAATPDHRCLIPDIENKTTALFNSSEAADYIPRTESGGMDMCHYYGPNETLLTCNDWVYDKTYHVSSRAIEWDFVCSRRWMGAVAQSAYMFGVFTGAVVLGSLADRYGRKKIFYISAVLQLLLGVGVAFVPEYYSFLFIRYLFGIFGSAGSYITGFVITMELVGPSKRTICGISFQAAFAVGVMLVAFWGFLIPDRQLLQIVYGLHSLLLIGHWWLIDESPRWLWSQGRTREAVAVVEKALHMNQGKRESDEAPLDVAHYVSKGRVVDDRNMSLAPNGRPAGASSGGGILDLFRTPNLCKKTLNVSLNWFANSIVYYGLSLNTGKLFGNPFLLLFLVGLVEWPSYMTTVYLMDRTGRRPLISALMVLGGISCITAAYIPQDTTAGSVSATTIVMIGKFLIAGSFAIIYNYTAELFPTVVRNTAIGVGSMFARLSGALTPLISLLDSVDTKLPTTIFAFISIISGLLSLLLPETLNQPMPQTLEEGERFGVGDTACSSCFGKRAESDDKEVTFTEENQMPLANVIPKESKDALRERKSYDIS
ncbi:organic cation transporter protein [Hetaerina americana]|uniref:organic cation transporter protein n=1 Tax=Hetaerina americana TaxID=62018 RepID=UPI003A7F5F41